MDEKRSFKIYDDGELGEVRIDTQVLAIIAGLAAVEVEGVSGLAGNMTNEIIERLGMKSLSKGVKVVAGSSSASIEIAVCLDYGVNIMNVSENIQEKVKNAVESMTGITIEAVNVRVANVNIENE